MFWFIVLACLPNPPDAEPTGLVDTVDVVTDDTANACAVYTWETAGAPFILTWCAPCHASALFGAQRQGAPQGINLDDAGATTALAPRVLARATGPSADMPPGGGPTVGERALLAAWLDCATP